MEDFEEERLCTVLLNGAGNCSDEHYNDKTKVESLIRQAAVAVPMAFAIIFLVGVTGNVLLILNFARHKKLSTPHNALVVNLAAGDLLMLIVGLPVNSVWYTFPYWPFGDFLCRLSRFAETFATAVTIATLATLSVERFLIVTGRRRQEPLSSVLIIIIVTVWLAGCVLSLPDIISAKLVQPPDHITNSSSSSDTNGSGAVGNGNGGGGGGGGGDGGGSGSTSRNETWEICVNHNPAWGEGYAQVNVMSKFLLLFVLPLLVIAPCYLGLAFHLFFKMFGSQGFPTSKTPLRPTTLAAPPRCVRPAAGDDDEDDDTKPLNNVARNENHLQDSRLSIASSRNDVSPNSISASAAAIFHQQQLENYAQKSHSDKRGGGGKKRKPATRKRRRLAWTVLGLVVSFVLCWMPRHVYLLWYHFDPSPFNYFWHVFKIVSFCLMFANSAVNPFVFYVLDVSFRAFVNAAILCRYGKSKKSPASTGGRGGRERGGGGGREAEAEGVSGVDGTVVGEMSPTEDKRSCIVMSEMPPGNPAPV